MIEACGFDSNPSNDDFCHDSNLVKNGLQIPKSDQNVSDKNNHNKLNCLRGNGFSKNPDASINRPAKLRPSPVNSEVVDNGHAENAKRQEYQSERKLLEPLPKRSKSCIKGNNLLTQADEHELNHVLLNGLDRECEFGAVMVDSNKHHKELNENCTKLNLHNSSNTRSTCMAILSDGLRYTQNATALPFLNKTPSRCTNGQSRKIGLETTSCTNIGSPLVSNSRDQTDSSQNICRNIASPLLKKHQNSNGGNHSRESPTTIGRNSLIIDTKCSTPKTRRFPGPAGILPRLEPGQNLENIPSPLTETPKKKSPELCHMINHDNDEDFSTEPWTVMQDEIRKRFPSFVDSLASIVKKATTQQLDKGKVAFLGVLVKSFRSTGLDVSVVLKDPSGEMRGTLHRKVLEEHQDELGPGCGLLLKQVTIYTIYTIYTVIS